MDYEYLLQNNPEIFNNENVLFEIITDKEQTSKWVEEQRSKLACEGKPSSWAEIGVVYEDPYIIVLRDLVRFPSGIFGGYFRILNRADLLGGQAIVILPTYNSKIVVLRQFRHPTRSWHWEVPRGFGESNTPAEDNAKKEIGEEIGGVVTRIVNLGAYHNNSGVEGSRIELFFAELSSIGLPNSDEGIKEYQLFKVTEFERMIRDSEVTDGFTIAAFTRAKLRNLLYID